MITSVLADNRNFCKILGPFRQSSETFLRVLPERPANPYREVAIVAMQDLMHKVAWAQCTIMIASRTRDNNVARVHTICIASDITVTVFRNSIKCFVLISFVISRNYMYTNTLYIRQKKRGGVLYQCAFRAIT